MSHLRCINLGIELLGCDDVVLAVAVGADRNVFDALDVIFPVHTLEVTLFDADMALSAGVNDVFPGDAGQGIRRLPDIVSPVAARAVGGQRQAGFFESSIMDALIIAPDEFVSSFCLDPLEMTGFTGGWEVHGKSARFHIVSATDFMGAVAILAGYEDRVVGSGWLAVDAGLDLLGGTLMTGLTVDDFKLIRMREIPDVFKVGMAVDAGHLGSAMDRGQKFFGIDEYRPSGTRF